MGDSILDKAMKDGSADEPLPEWRVSESERAQSPLATDQSSGSELVCGEFEQSESEHKERTGGELVGSIAVLVTGAGSPGAPGVVKSLRVGGAAASGVAGTTPTQVRIIGVDMKDSPVARQLSDAFYVVPPATDPAFIPLIADICRRERIDVVLPMVSAELVVLAKNRELLEQAGCRVSVSSPDALAVAINKGRLYRFLDCAGIGVPEFRVVKSAEQLLSAIHNLGYPTHPVCFKPIIGDGSRGFHILDPHRNSAHHLFNEKPNSAYLSYSELTLALQSVRRIPPLLVMEYLPGDEYSVDLLARPGQVLTSVPRLREATVGGITTRGLVPDVTDVSDVMECATSVVEALRLYGNIGVQVRRDVSGGVKVIEVNPRLQGTVVHCTGAGVNLPYLAVKLALDLPIRQEELRIRWGTRVTRYWAEVFTDADGHPFVL